MAILTKTEAGQMAVGYQNRFTDRLDRFLRNRAQSGHVGGTVSYADEDGLTSQRAQELRTQLQSAGWTVVVDTNAKTVAIS